MNGIVFGIKMRQARKCSRKQEKVNSFVQQEKSKEGSNKRSLKFALINKYILSHPRKLDNVFIVC